MLTLRGMLVNVLRRDPRPGAANQFESYAQAQLQTEEVLDDGQVKIGLHTLSFDVKDMGGFEPLKGKTIDLPVRVYVKGAAVAFAIEGGAIPHEVRKAPLAA